MKKLISLLVILCLLLTGSAALAEKSITVNGSGEIRISADTAVISLGVSARDPDVLTAQQKVNTAIAAIREALIGHGVKEENINTEYISIYALYDYTNDREQLTAYFDGLELTGQESARSCFRKRTKSICRRSRRSYGTTWSLSC